MILNFAPLGWSCWYSIPVKDGVLRERGFQDLYAKVCFVTFLLLFYCHSLSTLASLRFVISLMKQIFSEDLWK
jgi:hypothetical protein